MSNSITGFDTVKIGGRILTDFADGDNVTLTPPNDIVTVKTGKNGNSLYALNSSGLQVDVSVRLIRGTADDKFLNGQLTQFIADPASYILLDGLFVKRVGDGQGNVTNDQYVCSGGVISKTTEAKSNAEGDTDQSLVVYNLKYTNAPRVIG